MYNFKSMARKTKNADARIRTWDGQSPVVLKTTAVDRWATPAVR